MIILAIVIVQTIIQLFLRLKTDSANWPKYVVYGALDLCNKRTRANKRKLLTVSDFSFLPLHNNDSELGARKVVRKRDISLHTWTDWGTQLRNAFPSIIETVRKIRVPIYQDFHDRISGSNKEIALAEMIRLATI